METKMITIPFDLERAKRIQEGKEEGRIITREGKKARIICWDLKSKCFSLVALILNCDEESTEEYDYLYTKKGFFDSEESSNKYDLVLEVPEYTQYKDGDILVDKNGKCPFIYKGVKDDFCDYYAGICITGNLKFRDFGAWCPISEVGGYANKEQKQKLIKVLKESKEPLAKEYLKRFFNIEKEEFKPFDKVLVRDAGNIWSAAFFSHYNEDSIYPYFTTGSEVYEECIPYNEETKHLLGTTANY